MKIKIVSTLAYDSDKKQKKKSNDTIRKSHKVE